ncbi:MAG TPA: hypothetical protein VF520_12680 [Thermoleophilaceae bacterium]|jgi:hypothetical protein
MLLVLALNFDGHGVARFSAMREGEANLLAITARLAPDAVSRDAVLALLRDAMVLSRRVDELTGDG